VPLGCKLLLWCQLALTWKSMTENTSQRVGLLVA
jgi:hypothetical protein